MLSHWKQFNHEVYTIMAIFFACDASMNSCSFAPALAMHARSFAQH